MTPNFYAVIPADVRYSSATHGAKLLYGELTALSTKEGYCWATNEYFAALYDVNANTISEWIGQLKKLGFVSVEIDKPNGNSRKIWVAIPKKRDTYPEKTGEGYPEKTGDSINYIYPSTTSNYTVVEEAKKPKKKTSTTDTFIRLFRSVNPFWQRLLIRPADLDAVPLLLEEHPMDWWVDFMPKYAEAIRTDKYMPKATSPSQMLEKLPNIQANIQSKLNSKKVKII